MTTGKNSHGMIAVDKIGTKVLFLNPQSFATEVVIDGFPRTVARGIVKKQMLLRLQYVLHAGDGGIINLDEFRIVEVDAGAVHGPQHAVGDIRRAGIGKEMPAAGLG